MHKTESKTGRLRYLVVVGLLAEVAEDNLFEQLAVGVVLRKKTHLYFRALFTMAVPSLSWQNDHPAFILSGFKRRSDKKKIVLLTWYRVSASIRL